MKLRHTLAGTVALPLALAVASANAATVVESDKGKLEVGGYISGVATWNKSDKTDHEVFGGMDSAVDHNITLGLSRLNFTYTNDAGVKLFYENDWAGGHSEGANDGGTGYRLRHAAVSYNGFVAGQTWSGFANLTGLGETIDPSGTSSTASWANRAAVIGYNAPVADGMTVGIYLEDQNVGSAYKGRKNSTALPDVTLNFKGDFGDVDVFAGVRLLNVDEQVVADKEVVGKTNETEYKVDFALGMNYQITEEFNLKAAVTSYDEGQLVKFQDGRDMAVAIAAGFKVNEQLRFNAIAEQFIAGVDSDASYTSLWVNGFYTLDSGLELGAELQYTNGGDGRDVAILADDGANFDDYYHKSVNRADGDLSFRLQAKYAF